MARAGRILRIFGVIVGGLGLCVVALGLFANSGAGGALIAGYVARVASAPGSVLTIGGLDHALGGAPVVRDIAIADANGVWFKIDRVEMRWRPFALLHGVADIDALDVGAVDVLRKPLAAPPLPNQPGVIETIRAAIAWRPPVAVRLR